MLNFIQKKSLKIVFLSDFFVTIQNPMEMMQLSWHVVAWGFEKVTTIFTYLTVIVILAFLPLKVFTVITALPFFFAFTTPVLETVAIFFLLVEYVSL